MPALLAALERIGYSRRLSKTICISAGDNFRADFEIPVGAFCFLTWRLPLRACLRPCLSGAVSGLGAVVSLAAALARSNSSVCVDPIGTFSFQGNGSDAGWLRCE